MINILLRYEDGRQTTLSAIAPAHIGRDPACAVRIRHWRVAKRHASIVVIGDALAIEDHGSLLGTSVNGQRIATHSPLLATDRIVIGPCLIQVSTTRGIAGVASDPERYRSNRSGGEQEDDADADIVRQRFDAGVILGTGNSHDASDEAGRHTPSDAMNAASDGAAPSTVDTPVTSTAHNTLTSKIHTALTGGAHTALTLTTPTITSAANAASTSAASSLPISTSDRTPDTGSESTPDSSRDGGANQSVSIPASEIEKRGACASTRVTPTRIVSPVRGQTVMTARQAGLIDDTCDATRYATDQPILNGDSNPIASPGSEASLPDIAAVQAQDARDRSAHDALLHALDLRRHDVATMSDAALRHVAGDLLMQILREDGEMSAQEQALRCRRILDEVVGLGPLESLLEDEGISEIMINRYDDIYIERAGRLHAAALRFTSEQALRRIIDRIVSRVGRRVDESMPMVDARLIDGSRVNAVLPPVALQGAVLTIRKFMRTRLQMADLVRTAAMSEEMAAFLRLCVARRASIVIAGGTGSGKTTLLNILADAIPSGERIVTIEDSAELRLGHAHLVALEARPPNVEGRGLITIRDLVRNALRMRPDRIVVGECRGAEAFDMLAAMNTGHEGSMTTLHANTPRDALARLETMIMMANMGLPLSVVREHVVSSIDVIVQQRRLANGRRVVTEIVELAGMESGCIQLQSLFRFSGATGAFAWGGVLPGIVQRWRAEGHAIDVDMFLTGSNGPDSPSGAGGASGAGSDRRRF